ncbi:MAG: PIN domain-containing protein [Ardenticatenaceae bacterium]
MRVLLDTNVILDVLLNRTPSVTEAKAVWQAHEDGRITGYMTATTMTDIFYIAHRLTDRATARTAVRTCLDTFEICEVNRSVLEQAETLPGNDFEDNVQITCANIAGLDAIVTRYTADFRSATKPVFTPAQLLIKGGYFTPPGIRNIKKHVLRRSLSTVAEGKRGLWLPAEAPPSKAGLVNTQKTRRVFETLRVFAFAATL